MAGEAPAVAPAAAPAPNGAANGTPPPNGAPKAAEESWEFNEDGKSFKLTHAETQKQLADARYARKRLQQAADEAKTLKAEKAKFEAERADDAKLRKENRAEWLKRHELDEEAMAREVLERKLKEQEMTPDQREAAKRKAEADDLRKQLDERKQADSKAQVDQTAKHITQWMVDGLQKAATAAGLAIGPREFHVIHAVAAEFGDAVPLDGEWHNRVINEAKERIEGAYGKLESAVAAGLSGEALVKRLGKRVVDEVLKYRLEQVRGKKTFGAGRPAAEPPPVAKPSKYITTREAEEQLRKASKL